MTSLRRVRTLFADGGLRLPLLVGLAAASGVVAHPAPAAGQTPFTRVGVTLPQNVTYASVAPADYDGDGDPDLLVVRTDPEAPTMHPELYRNDGAEPDGSVVFTPVPFPAPAFTAASPPGTTVSWGDYDADGDVDALVATRDTSTLYRNDGGIFAEAGADLPHYVERWTYYFADPRSSAWGDMDNDGDLDLALPAYSAAYPDTSRLVLYRNDAGTLSPTADVFPQADRDLDISWGDVDGDGDLDLLYLSAGSPCAAWQPIPAECLVVYDNDAGTLSARVIDFPEIEGGAADLGDFDLDGDLDILLVAAIRDDSNSVHARAIVYRNEGAAFSADTLGFPFEFDSAFDHLTAGRWADYDSDGDVDLLIGANVRPDAGPVEESGGLSFVFANVEGSFALVAALPASALYGTQTWADFDSDGDLDLLATGNRLENIGGNQWGWVDFARLYRNEAVAPNAPPTAPGELAAEPTADGVTLAWGPASDDHTPAEGLTYNLWVRRAEGAVMSPMSRAVDGRRLVPQPGNAGASTEWTLRDLAPGTYTWTVQAVDNAFSAGAFAPEGSFTVGTVPVGPGPAQTAVALRDVLPNPAASEVAVVLDIPRNAVLSIALFDATGRRVLTLPAQELAAGVGRRLLLDVEALPAGTYVLQVLTGAGGAVEPRTARITVAR